MTLIAGLLVSLVYGITSFMPVSVTAHEWALNFFAGQWGYANPGGHFSGMLAAGALTGLMIYFRHDWASIISSFLRVILLRQKPMTIDERLMFFIILTTLPVAFVWQYVEPALVHLEISAYMIAASLVIFSVPLWLANNLNRQTKSMLDWTLVDSLIVGIVQVGALVPGAGRQILALSGAFFRNFNRESAAKFTFLTFAPLLCYRAWRGLDGFTFSAEVPMENTSWMVFSMCFVMTTAASILSIAGFMKDIQYRSVGKIIFYRCMLATAIAVTYWFNS